MRPKLAISHTYRPCGTKVHYPFGMARPNLTNMGHIMKKAAFQAVQEQSKPQRKLKVA